MLRVALLSRHIHDSGERDTGEHLHDGYTGGSSGRLLHHEAPYAVYLGAEAIRLIALAAKQLHDFVAFDRLLQHLRNVTHGLLYGTAAVAQAKTDNSHDAYDQRCHDDREQPHLPVEP